MKQQKLKKHIKTNEELAKVKVESSSLRKVLSDIIKEDLKSLEVFDEYDNPNWAYKQAEVNGKRKVYQLFLKLLEDLN